MKNIFINLKNKYLKIIKKLISSHKILLFYEKYKIEKGQVAIIIGILIIPLIMMLSYVIDVGSMYQTRRNVQTAADAAALAGAQELPQSLDRAREKAIEYAQFHGNVTLLPEAIHFFDNKDIESTVNPTKIVVITSDASTPLFFSGIFGVNSVTISATATAKVYSPTGLKGLVPFAIHEEDIKYDTETVLKSDNPQVPGWFGLMDYSGGGGGASEIRDTTREGYSGEVFLNNSYNVETGGKVGPVCQGLQDRIDSDSDPFCTFDKVTEILPDGSLGVTGNGINCPRIVIVVIIPEGLPEGGHGWEPVPVIGFAAFYVSETGTKEVTGQFVKVMLVTSVGDAQDYNGGIKVIRLIK